MSADLYTMLSTSRREIRLATLLPGKWANNIECELSTTSLDDNPKYEALSYVWGDPRVTYPILVNGVLLSVTTNLHMALRRLRYDNESRIIWIDAICINQVDVVERTQQVNIMGDIYKSTQQVLIWLGEVESPIQLDVITWHDSERDNSIIDEYFQERNMSVERCTRSSFTEMADIHGAFTLIRMLADGTHLFELPFFQLAGEYILSCTDQWEQAIRGLKALVNLPWWHRVWVLQETILPPKATVYYSNIIAPWMMIVRAVHHLFQHYTFCCNNYLNSRPIQEEEILIMFTRVVQKIDVICTTRAKGKRVSLSQLLSLTLDRLATDSRDKVYTLLTLVTNWYQRKQIRSNYELTIPQVYSQAVFEEIQGSRSLQILQGIPNDSIPGLPSWVMRTSSEHLRNSQDSRINASSLFKTSKDVLANVQMSGESMLGVLGHEDNDTVIAVSSHIWGTPETSKYAALAATLRAWYDLVVNSSIPDHNYPNCGGSWEDVFWRTVAADAVNQFDLGAMAPDSDIAIRTSWRRLNPQDREVYDAWLLRTKAAAVYTGPDGTRLPGSSIWSYVSESRCIIFDQAVAAATIQRRFFTTQKGFMGTGPAATSPGDKIVILFGGDTPFLLCEQSHLLPNTSNDSSSTIYDTEVENFWALHRDCFIYGIMDGEAMNNWESRNRRYWLR